MVSLNHSWTFHNEIREANVQRLNMVWTLWNNRIKFTLHTGKHIYSYRVSCLAYLIIIFLRWSIISVGFMCSFRASEARKTWYPTWDKLRPSPHHNTSISIMSCKRRDFSGRLVSWWTKDVLHTLLFWERFSGFNASLGTNSLLSFLRIVRNDCVICVLYFD